MDIADNAFQHRYASLHWTVFKSQFCGFAAQKYSTKLPLSSALARMEMHKLSFLIVFSIISLNVIGEPIGYNREYKYEKVRILSCETSEHLMLKKAEFRNYSLLNKRKLLESAKNLIILDVIPLFEVEYITSVYNGSTRHYLGKVTSLTNPKRNKFHMRWASCEKYQKNNEVIFSISSGYHCMSEPVSLAYQETEAACLIEYEIANEAFITGSR